MQKFKQIKIKPLLGSLPEHGATDWWTQEDWDKHNAYVGKLKKEGKYMTEGEEITIKIVDNPIFDQCRKPFNEQFSNFGIIIPQKNHQHAR